MRGGLNNSSVPNAHKLDDTGMIALTSEIKISREVYANIILFRQKKIIECIIEEHFYILNR